MNFQKGIESIGKGILWIFLGMIISKAFFLLTQILIARGFGAEKYGMISIGVTFLAIISIFTRLGLDNGIKRFIPEYKSKVQEIMSFSTLAVFSCSFLVALILYLFADIIAVNLFGSVSLGSVLKIFFISIPIYSLAILFLRGLEGFFVMKYRLWIEGILFGAILLGFVTFVLKSGGSIVTLSKAYLITYVFMLATSFIALLSKTKLSFSKIKFSLGKKLLSYSWPLAFYPSLEIIIRYANIIIIGFLLSEKEVGMYSSALSIAVLGIVFLSVINPIFFPVASSLKKKKDSSDLYYTSVKWIFMLTIPFIFFGIFFSKEIILLFFGTSYISAYPVLILLLLGFFIEILAGPVEFYLSSLDRTKLVMGNMLAATGLSILLAFVFIPSLGLVGAAMAYSLAILTQKALGIIELYWVENIFPYKGEFRRILLFSIFLCLLVYFASKINVAGIVLSGILIILYFILCLKFCMEKSDKAIFDFIRKFI